MTVDDVMEKHAQLIEEARAITRTIADCRTAQEVEDTCRRVVQARQRAADYLDSVVAMMRAEPDDLPRA